MKPLAKSFFFYSFLILVYHFPLTVILVKEILWAFCPELRQEPGIWDEYGVHGGWAALSFFGLLFIPYFSVSLVSEEKIRSFAESFVFFLLSIICAFFSFIGEFRLGGLGVFLFLGIFLCRRIFTGLPMPDLSRAAFVSVLLGVGYSFLCFCSALLARSESFSASFSAWFFEACFFCFLVLPLPGFVGAGMIKGAQVLAVRHFQKEEERRERETEEEGGLADI
ncbi:MAG: hypothetical protein Q4D17_02985 [Planctomycetia bacterium]|nr:hypothetical protein [Planctomycetia bacterium]